MHDSFDLRRCAGLFELITNVFPRTGNFNCELAGAACGPFHYDRSAGVRLPHPDGRVTIDDVRGDAEARGLAGDVVQTAIGTRHEECAAGRLRAETGVVERELVARIDVGIRPATGRS
jgi:hypothetical protein